VIWVLTARARSQSVSVGAPLIIAPQYGGLALLRGRAFEAL
jgi:hypothetical protein